ncbi:hypothetical protein ATANTOWER_032766 [Ataeniobius toweri]|uniref:Uncharacterized protein n=1 Tax=Ataeniobius toweri TaxID=208326 RepID=A0ABU7CK34_9TELE|nr:hypothetical protein [Ataeniobius toweri]
MPHERQGDTVSDGKTRIDVTPEPLHYLPDLHFLSPWGSKQSKMPVPGATNSSLPPPLNESHQNGPLSVSECGSNRPLKM